MKDEVQLTEAWHLDKDIPRWFSETIDTIGDDDTTFSSVPFDSVIQLIEKNKWHHNDFTSGSIRQRLAGHFQAEMVVSGTVSQFKVMKRAVNADAPISATHEIGKHTSGAGGVTVMGGLQSYTAEVTVLADIYSGGSGELLQTLPLTTQEKDAGFKVWLPFNQENTELYFYRMTREPFGSASFKKTVIGGVMNAFSHRLRQNLQNLRHSSSPPQRASGKRFLEGTILERNNSEVYLNLGTDDGIFAGERFTVFQPDYPLTGNNGDTLGWVDKAVGEIEIRFIRARHFSQAHIIDEADSIRSGWNVRYGEEIDSSETGATTGVRR